MTSIAPTSRRRGARRRSARTRRIAAHAAGTKTTQENLQSIAKPYAAPNSIAFAALGRSSHREKASSETAMPAAAAASCVASPPCPRNSGSPASSSTVRNAASGPASRRAHSHAAASAMSTKTSVPARAEISVFG